MKGILATKDDVVVKLIPSRLLSASFESAVDSKVNV